MTTRAAEAQPSPKRYVPQRAQRTRIPAILERVWGVLNGPAKRPSLVTRLAVSVAVVAIAALCTSMYWRNTGVVLIEFYLIACVLATWYGGLLTGVMVVLVVSVLQFGGPLEPGTGWQTDQPSAWIRLAILTTAALSFGLMWEALDHRKRELAAAVEDLQVVIDLVPIAIGMAEVPEVNYIRINPTMADMIGVEPGVIASGPIEEPPRHFRFCREGKEIPGDELPVQRAAATGQRTHRERLDIVLDDGTTTHVIGQAVPLFGIDGELRGAVGAFDDITDELEIQRELRNANNVKDEFLGLVSHELRTPITVIRGNAEVLDERGSQIDAESRAVAIKDIRVEADRLARIVDNLLALSKLGLMELEREPLNLRSISEQVVDEHRRHEPARPISVSGEVPSAAGSPIAVERIVNNLLTNAERYSPPNAPIELLMRQVDGEAQVSVRDHGIGIPPEEAEKVFAPFYRAETRSKAPSGIGIGLTVCQRLVEAQGGRIWIDQPAGGGAEVTFALPIAVEESSAPS